jgi:hypothetical protein
MLTKNAHAHFGPRRADIAHALGDCRSASAVYQWDEVVPLAAARRLAVLSNGALTVDESLYDEMGRIIPRPKKAKRRAA